MKSNNNYMKSAVRLLLPALFVVVAIPSAAHAQYEGDFSGGCCDFITPSSIDYSYPYDGYITPTSIDYEYPYTEPYITPSSVDYEYPYTDQYITPSSVDYTYPYSSSYGSSYGYPYSSYYMPSVAAAYGSSLSSGFIGSIPLGTSGSSRTDIFAPTNTTIANNGNSCTAGNSCNTTISTPTTISYNNAGSAYPVYYPAPTYPTYSYPTYQNPAPTCYITVSPSSYLAPGQAATITWSATNTTYGTISNIGSVAMSGSRTIYPYGNMTYTGSFSGPGGSTNCYATVSVNSYQAAPYVSLSQVPYTGLDLGPVGTAFYWLFLVLWCMIGAYLITVKKVQNRLMLYVRKFLLGDEHIPRHPVYQRMQPAPVAAPVKTIDGIDSFIASQINRNK